MKKTIVVIIAVIVIVFALLFWKPKSPVVNLAPEAAANQTAAVATDNTSIINADLSAIDANGGLEADFNSLDADINTL